jgi:ectoine hydroxylase-related dioxygenase (phytanoyl-CoA dioxygenase family)
VSDHAASAAYGSGALRFEAAGRAFKERGVVIIEYALRAAELERMAALFDGGGRRHGRLAPADLSWLAAHPVLCALAQALAGAPARLVRVIAFDKTAHDNWFVPWHQDRTIAVRNRVEHDGFQNWTTTDGLVQVEPPLAVLEAMVTLRIHIDPCHEDNGPLEVIPGSHRAGRLNRNDVATLAAASPSLVCLLAAGDVLAMHPLTVHRSQRARVPANRRVLHLEWCAASLPQGLDFSIGLAM